MMTHQITKVDIDDIKIGETVEMQCLYMNGTPIEDRFIDVRVEGILKNPDTIMGRSNSNCLFDIPISDIRKKKS